MGFATILKLKKFLSRHNLELLNVILGELIDARSQSFQVFWKAFAAKRAGNLDEVEYACNSLSQLRDILGEYLKEMT